MSNRELRFRAWDVKEKKWIAKGFSIIGECTVFGILEQFQQERIKKYPGSSLLLAMNDILIEQYIGRKDQNKTDVYDNDICEFEPQEEDGEILKGVVEYGFGGSSPWIGNYMINEVNIRKIIGNIHDNPDLLEAK